LRKKGTRKKTTYAFFFVLTAFVIRFLSINPSILSNCNKATTTPIKTLIALSCGDAPERRSRWTLRLLRQQMVETGLC